MKKAFPIIIILLVFIAICSVALILVPSMRYGAFGVNLKYGFKQGNTDNYTEKTDISFKGDAAESGSKSVSYNSEKKLSIETTKVDSDSAFLVLRSETTAKEASIDGKIKTGIPAGNDKSNLSIKVTPSGKILELEAPGVAPENREKALKLYQFFSGFIMLPEKAVRPGQTWSQPVDAEFDQDYLGLNTPLKGTITHKLVRVENYKGVMAALIESSGTFKADSSLLKTNILSMETVVNIKGSLYFDIKNGMPIHCEREITLDMTKTVPVLNTKIKAGSTVKTVLDKASQGDKK
jgi:hypothetical protein